jgi:nitrogen-specific signal transduction histidine kinase/ActR/RegA family two-component response regulator
MICKDGSARWVSSKGAVIESENGKPLCVMGTYADITERKEAAQALADAHQALVRTDRIVTMAEFSASIAHELKQPLTAIAANAQACLRAVDPIASSSDVRAALNDMVDESMRASDIVNRTQEMFTKHPMRKTAMNLNDGVRHILEMAGGRLRQSGIRVEVKLDDGLPAVLADAVQVQQVLLNLIVNAVEAMAEVPTEQRVLRISSRRGRRVAIVTVRDRGRGLDPHDERLFAPFYTTKPTGVGMGLAISRSIVTNHGGSLWAVMNGHGGATFRFTLPLLTTPVPIEDRTPSPRRRVLVVDDDQGLRRAVTRLLRTSGHEVAVAHDGSGGLAAAEAFQPDVAIVDISLPDMSGLEVGRRLRKIFPGDRMQLIALTGNKDDHLRQACAAAGFDVYLVKPQGIQELERLLPGSPTPSWLATPSSKRTSC